MVRLLKVKELEERKRFLLARSEMYRQTLTLEVANIKFSGALLKRKLRSPKSLLVLLGLAAPAAGFFMGRRRAKVKAEAGPAAWVPRLLAGWKLVSRFAPLLMKLRPVGKRQPVERHDLRRVSG